MRWFQSMSLAVTSATGLLVLASCAHVTVDPIEVKPIYITMDVNIKVDRQLDQFFAFEDKYQAPSSTTTSTTQPSAATQPTAAIAGEGPA
jgi:hypothetical protein